MKAREVTTYFTCSLNAFLLSFQCVLIDAYISGLHESRCKANEHDQSNNYIIQEWYYMRYETRICVIYFDAFLLRLSTRIYRSLCFNDVEKVEIRIHFKQNTNRNNHCVKWP